MEEAQPVAPSVPRPRVLIVEDNADGANSTALLLRHWGYDVHIAYDGPAAVEAFQAQPSEVVLLDLGLPGLDGFEVARRLRGLVPGGNLTLIAITGYNREDDRRQADEAGFAWYLLKPVDPEFLHNLLKSLEPGQS